MPLRSRSRPRQTFFACLRKCGGTRRQRRWAKCPCKPEGGPVLKFTILGCGSSGGVPRPALGWGDCNPNNPRNRRRRTSLLVERNEGAAVTRVLVDTSPDL